MLLAINGAAIDLAAAGDTRPHSRTRGFGIGACGIGGGVESGKKVGHGIPNAFRPRLRRGNLTNLFAVANAARAPDVTAPQRSESPWKNTGPARPR